MVCLPCCVVPVVLWIFYRFLQPILLRLWALWKGKDTDVANLSAPKFTDEMLQSEPGKYIQKTIKENPVVMFSKTTCSYCKLTKETLNEIGVSYAVEEINGREDMNDLQNIFEKLTGERTVPRVFVGGKIVGGASQTLSLHNKKLLVPLMEKAGATFKSKSQ